MTLAGGGGLAGGDRFQLKDMERWVNSQGPGQLESDNSRVNDAFNFEWTSVPRREFSRFSLTGNVLREQPNSLSW